MSERSNLLNQRFGRWYVLDFAYVKNNKTWWLCECDCGTIKPIVGNNLNNGKTQSCGCLRKEQLSDKGRGKIIPKEVRRKISETLKGRYLGKDNPNYNPNLTDEERRSERNIPGYSKWRKAVYERDNYTCVVCGDDTGGNLVAHHLESYRDNPELRTKLSNGATVCEKHHIDFHHQYGFGKNTRKQFEKFIIENSPKQVNKQTSN